jgi:acetokinase family protein
VKHHRSTHHRSTSRRRSIILGSLHRLAGVRNRRYAQKCVALRDSIYSRPTGSDHPHAPAAIGHRIVHVGPKLRQHCLIDNSVLRQPEAVTAFAPLHTPSALSVIRFHQTIFRGFRRWRVSTPLFFTPNCRRSHVSFRSPRNCNWRVSNATGFMAFRRIDRASNLQTIYRTAWCLVCRSITAMVRPCQCPSNAAI